MDNRSIVNEGYDAEDWGNRASVSMSRTENHGQAGLGSRYRNKVNIFFRSVSIEKQTQTLVLVI